MLRATVRRRFGKQVAMAVPGRPSWAGVLETLAPMEIRGAAPIIVPTVERLQPQRSGNSVSVAFTWPGFALRGNVCSKSYKSLV